MLIHVLSADIPHHNQTVLAFFDRQLTSSHREKPIFWVVSSENQQARYPQLKVVCYPTKRAIARAVIGLAIKSRETRFFFHGLFNLLLWVGILSGAVRSTQSFWHIWGADLYEQAKGIKFRLFYQMRRLAQRRIGRVFGTRGDLSLFRLRCPEVAKQRLYFPTRMPSESPVLTKATQATPMTILLGNSGDISNRHPEALQAIHQQCGDRVNLIIPMGYPPDNQVFADRVRQQACALFGSGNVHIITQQIAFSEYCQLLSQCSLGYFNFARQQGIGTLCLLIDMGIPFVISRENRFQEDLREQQIPVLFNDEPLDEQRVRMVQEQLRLRDKSTIAFMPAAYLADWQDLLKNMEGDAT
ncbi:MAG: TDP-N-acetylfucosamine:lipid II N-acetylfucosaminyltransferase [Candidatus Erwinia impunctatus]|nr:TDP-N-acetylfucosamine:lipid II N-acetylfucosaminyltransferase [Culicoides impunctatus]